MTPAFRARGRAEEFNSLIEDTSTSALRDARYADLLELVGTLRTATPVEARPGFVADLREQLMAEAATVLVPSALAPAAPRRRNPRERRIAVAMGGFAILGATTSMAVAAQTALPGETLYPLKRAIENAQTGVQVDDDSKGTVMLANASGRLDELDELSRSSDQVDAATISDTLYAFTAQATEASDLLLAAYQQDGRATSIQELRAFAAESMQTLADLEGLVPDEARPALIEAARVLEQIDAQALYACPVCSSQPLGEIPALAAAPIEDILGPRSGTPVAPPAEPSAGPKAGNDFKPDREKEKPGNQDGDKFEDPAPDDPADPDIDVDPPEQPDLPDPGADDDQPSDQPDQGPLEELTKGLTGGGSKANNGGGLAGVLSGAVNGVVSGVTKGQTGPQLP